MLIQNQVSSIQYPGSSIQYPVSASLSQHSIVDKTYDRHQIYRHRILKSTQKQAFYTCRNLLLLFILSAVFLYIQNYQ